jgi:hypothetical protein
MATFNRGKDWTALMFAVYNNQNAELIAELVNPGAVV